MATLVKTPSGTWKAVIRKQGWPTASKTFRTKRDAEDWSRRAEDEMVRGVYIQRSGSERMTLEAALKRYTSEVTPTKKPSTQRGETSKAKKLAAELGKYSHTIRLRGNHQHSRLNIDSKSIILKKPTLQFLVDDCKRRMALVTSKCLLVAKAI